MARELGVSSATVAKRLERGMTMAEARADLERRAQLIAAGVPVRGPIAPDSKLPKFIPGVSGKAAVPIYNPRAVKFTKPDSRHAKPPDISSNGQTNGQSSPGNSRDMFEAQLKKEQALAEQQHMKARQMSGELVESKEVEQWYANLIVKLRDYFLRVGSELGDRLAVETVPSECARLVEEKIREGLQIMRKMGKVEVSE